jgi:hypothetical protein
MMFAVLQAGCTMIIVEGDANRIRDAGGHGGLALPEIPASEKNSDWLERLERLEAIVEGKAQPQ